MIFYEQMTLLAIFFWVVVYSTQKTATLGGQAKAIASPEIATNLPADHASTSCDVDPTHGMESGGVPATCKIVIIIQRLEIKSIDVVAGSLIYLNTGFSLLHAMIAIGVVWVVRKLFVLGWQNWSAIAMNHKALQRSTCPSEETECTIVAMQETHDEDEASMFTYII